MAYPYQYLGYQTPYYGQPVPDQLTQLRQNSGIIWVGSKMEADNYLIAPNSAVALWDVNNPVVYLRQADGTGKPTTKVFDLVERSEGAKTNVAPQIGQVTREEFDAIVDRLTALENKPCDCKSGGRGRKKEEQSDE